ncbi:hypothetical protein [Sphingomonas mucosissima]|uniref:hypothetical protein n=1 Tax=Sphingomonas mucosissima TaxID=370959 RepID=UPI003CCB8826
MNNDPCGENGFGSVAVDEATLFWKIIATIQTWSSDRFHRPPNAHLDGCCVP